MYLIVGANGYLGSYIIKAILEKTSDDIIAVTRDIRDTPKLDSKRVIWYSCDITNFSQVKNLNSYMKTVAINYKVVFLAAYHNPDLVMKNLKYAWNMNITCLAFFLNVMEGVEKLFYPSSDSVYGNSIEKYRFKEEDKTSPVNIYGKQKALAENIVIAYGYNVIRYPFLIAPSLLKNKKHFYDLIVDRILNSNPIEMFYDSYRSSLDFGQAANLLINTIETENKKCPSIMNICGDDALSKYDIGIMIADKIGVSQDLIIPVSINTTIDGVFKTPRAISTLMDNSKIKEFLGLNEIKIKL